jgi:hypothetical protein
MTDTVYPFTLMMVKYQPSERLDFHSGLKQLEAQKDFTFIVSMKFSSLTGINKPFKNVVKSDCFKITARTQN